MQKKNSVKRKTFPEITMAFAAVFLMGITVYLAGCSGLRTRQDTHQGKMKDAGRSGIGSGSGLSGGSGPNINPPPPPLQTSEPTTEGVGADALPEGAEESQERAQEQTFLNRELPKIGVILGPGGMKAYAHVGVLAEFARARIPIHAITGLEWGAFMAAAYAEKGQANDVDWKAFRLREGDIPSAGVLQGYKPKRVEDLDGFLRLAFPAGLIQQSAVPFGCPAVFKREQYKWQGVGATRLALQRCLPFPPLVIGNKGYTAAASAVIESAKWLRSKGATLIVLVNVLGAGEPLSAKLADEQYGASMLWTEIRRELLAARAPTVNWIVSVNTAGQKIDDFASRRTAVELGKKAAKDLTQKLTKQYGF